MMDNPFEMMLDRLRSTGWCKYELGGWDGPNCLLGAEMCLQQSVDLYKYIMPLVKNEYSERGNELISAFNNHPDTTFSDVERVLEKAAVKWEEEQVTR